MAIKQDFHQFQGLQLDKGSINQDTLFLKDAYNIRITPRDNLVVRQNYSGTLITNERGPLDINIQVPGVYIGHAVLNKQLVLFTHLDTTDYIHKVDFSQTQPEITRLFEGNLNFDPEHPIETLADYETDYIQKVYWTDGLNQPRVINIAGTIKKNQDDTFYADLFDFVQKLQLNENVTVERSTDTAGEFDPGTIQYAFTYYNEFLLESNVFYTTPIFYLSHPDRGGKPEDKVTNSFKITVTNPDTNFDYIRIYSIQRTAINDTPLTRRVQDIKLVDNLSIVPLTSILKVVMQSYFNTSQWKDNLRGRSQNIEYRALRVGTDSNFLYYKWPEDDTFQQININFTNADRTCLQFDGDSKIYWKCFVLPYNTYKDSEFKLVVNDKDLYFKINKSLIIIYNDVCYDLYEGGTGIQSEYGVIDNYYVYWGNLTVIRPNTHQEDRDCILSYNNRDVPLLYKIVENPYAGESYVSYIDTGLTGETVDPKELLFLGGYAIKAKTLTLKDGTIFLGNITTNSQYPVDGENKIILGYDTDNPFYIPGNITSITTKKALREVSQEPYLYYTSLDSYTGGFKNNEWYRLGIQLLDNTGKWSPPIWVGDARQTEHPSLNEEGLLTIPGFNYTLNQNAINVLQNNPDFIRIRPIVVFPTAADRNVAVQGILCPTLYTDKHRNDDKDVYSQSSWFMRPFRNTHDSGSKGRTLVYDNNEGWSDQLGYPAAYWDLSTSNPKHLTSLKNVEIQGVFNDEDKFKIDESFVTLHSPELMFDEDTLYYNYSIMFPDWKGNVLFYKLIKDIDIICKTAPISVKGLGVVHKSFVIDFVENGNIALPGSWTSSGGYELPEPDYIGAYYSGLYFDDFPVCDEKNNSPNGDIPYFPWSSEYDKSKHALSSPVKWMIYPWHRTGSLNNDSERIGENSGARSAVLDTKRMSSLMFGDTTYDESLSFIGSMLDAQVFNSDQMEIIKVNGNIYQGNVDTLLASGKYSGFYFSYGSTNSEADVDALIGSLLTIIKNLLYSDYTSNPKVKTDFRLFLDTFISNHPDRSLEIADRLSAILNASDEIIKYELSVTLNKDTIAMYVSNIMLFDLYWKINNGYLWDNYHLISYSSDIHSLYNALDKINMLKSGVSEYFWSDQEIETSFNGVVNGKIFALTDTNSDKINVKKPRVFYMGLEPSGGNDDIGRTDGQLAIIRPNVRMKYRSTPHITMDLDGDSFINDESSYKITGYLYSYPIVDMCRYNNESVRESIMFGGTSLDALMQNTWIPAGEPIRLDELADNGYNIPFTRGDTWYQRYDLIKTYAFTPLDINQVVEIVSFMVESHINLDGRYDRNRGQVNNTQVNPTNFNLMNTVYSQLDNFFSYQLLEDRFYQYVQFNNQITWSTEKTSGMLVDPWTKTSLAATYDLDGDKGPITELVTNQSNIYCFQEKGISSILFNSRVQVETSDSVPIEISNNYKMEGKRYIAENMGTTNRKGVCSTADGIFFIDEVTKSFYLLTDKFSPISDSLAMTRWFTGQYNGERTPNNIEYQSIMHDSFNKDLYITGIPIDLNPDIYNEGIYPVKDSPIALCYSQQLELFTSFMSYGDYMDMFNIDNECYGIDTYMDTTNEWQCKIYKMFKGNYNVFMHGEDGGVEKPFYIEFISNADAGVVKTFSNVEVLGSMWKLDLQGTMLEKLSTNSIFDHVRLWNEYQDTGTVSLISEKAYPSNLKNKQGIWRIDVPRDKPNDQGNTYGLNRIKSTWSNVRLSTLDDLDENLKIEIYGVSVLYDVDSSLYSNSLSKN